MIESDCWVQRRSSSITTNNMQAARQSLMPQEAAQQRALRIAWLVLLTAFGIFCGLVSTAGYLAWDFYIAAMDSHDSLLIVRGQREWVTWLPPQRTYFQQATVEEQLIKEGAEVRIAPSAGYGQVATIRLFDQSTLDLWPGADVLLEKLQTSRWSHSEQTVALRQRGGYIRYDIRDDQPFQQISYRVAVGTAAIDMTPGGSYSIDLRPCSRTVLLPENLELEPVCVADVAVRSGRAELHSQGRSVMILPGQRVEIDPSGLPGLLVPARWELIRDGNFSEYDEVAYNNTTVPGQPMLLRSDSWQVYGAPFDSDASGFFKLFRACQPPETDSNCDPMDIRTIAGFVRTGNQTRNFTTGIQQDLGVDQRGVDVSEYRSLVFSAWVRVLYQSVPQTGDQGTECPVMIRFLGKRNSPVDPEQERVVCVYSSTDVTQAPVQASGVTYYRVGPYEWRLLRIELRDPYWMPDFRFLRRIQIYANGHDYDSRITGISLIGSHYSPEYVNAIP